MVIKAEVPLTSLLSFREAVKGSDDSATVPRISVIMPVFNGSPLLDRAVESLLLQTFQRWELLAIDDASTDDSHQRLLDWSHRDPRIRVFRLAENRGHAAARNEGLRQAAGSLVAYLDHDDEYYAGYLSGLIDTENGLTFRSPATTWFTMIWVPILVLLLGHRRLTRRKFSLETSRLFSA